MAIQPLTIGDAGTYLFADPAEADAASNFTYTGAPGAIGAFDVPYTISTIATGTAFVSLERGIFLSSGNYADRVNDNAGYSTVNDRPGDPDLDAAALAAYEYAGGTEDAAVLTFTVNAGQLGGAKSITFDLFFGSDEYPEFISSSFVDIAAVYVNGKNYALFNNDPEQPLSIIGPSVTPEGNFYDNSLSFDPLTGSVLNPTLDHEYDGISTKLTVLAPLTPGDNVIKIAIADTGDSILDSGLWIGNLKGSSATGSGSFFQITGSAGADTLQGNAAPQIVVLGKGADTYQGTPEQVNGDVITDWSDEDRLLIQGVSFGAEDVQITQGSAILDIDTDGDGTADTTIILEGDFSAATFSVVTQSGGTVISTEGAVPVASQSPDDPPVTIIGTDSDEIISGNGGSDGLFGQGGDDTIFGGLGDDNIGAGDGNDIAYGGAGNDAMGGGLGDDTVYGGGGNDFLGGGQGDDLVDGGSGNDVVNGGRGEDLLIGGSGNDVMGGAVQSDLLYGGTGDDDMGGGAAADEIYGGAGDDTVGGGEAADVIYGEDGNDILNGGGADDAIYGGAGDDEINGGAGDDVMRGGSGSDSFVFRGIRDGERDIIRDFDLDQDEIHLKLISQAEVDAARITNVSIGGTAYAQVDLGGHIVLFEGLTASQVENDMDVFVF